MFNKIKKHKATLIKSISYIAGLYFIYCIVYILIAAKAPDLDENIEMNPDVPISTLLKDTTNNTKKSFGDKMFLLNFEKIPNDERQQFVERFLNTAIVEKWKYNIPISIKLAQGMVESACGESKLSTLANNYFGMKCLSRCRHCDGKKWEIVGDCINATDDSKHDLFQIFKSPWYSWRAHSILLTKPRYNHLRKINPLNYKKWARGLKRAGYATHKKYAPVLINYIEQHKLDQYDKMPIEELAKMRGIDLSKIERHL